MKNQSLVKLVGGTIVLSSALALPVNAMSEETVEETKHEMDSGVQQAQQAASEAWRAGKIDALFLVNRHLNNFTINPEVSGDSVALIGKVESDVERELAEELALSVDGIRSVDNRLVVVSSKEARNTDDVKDSSDRKFSEKVADATLTAEVKMKLLGSAETDGLAIDVDTANSVVTLSGAVESSIKKDLAGKLASNVDGVSDVKNRLKVKS